MLIRRLDFLLDGAEGGGVIVWRILRRHVDEAQQDADEAAKAEPYLVGRGHVGLHHLGAEVLLHQDAGAATVGGARVTADEGDVPRQTHAEGRLDLVE